MTAVSRVCPRCGSPTGAAVLSAGLCPSCLLTTALADESPPVCPYRVLAPIAEGASGITYLAQGLRGTRAYVALKVFDRHDDTAAALARFARWKPRLDAVSHPSLARLLDAAVTAEGLLYAASEFVAGWPFASARTGALPMDARAALARQLADAVAAAHAGGVAHLGLTPSLVKVSMADGPRATILGLGMRLIVQGEEPRPGQDVSGLLHLIRELGIEMRATHELTASAIAAALTTPL